MSKKIHSQNLTSDKIVDLLAQADIHVTGSNRAESFAPRFSPR